MSLKTKINLFARQEIYDHKGSVCAYELLYRNSNANYSNLHPDDFESGDKATEFVLAHLFAELDINTVIGAHTAFINFTRNHILQKVPALLPKNRIFIELLENIVVDSELMENIDKMHKEGYRFALDDFRYSEETKPLLDYAEIVKIDVLGLSEKQIQDQLLLLADYKGKLLAEKIETRAQLTICKKLGFHYFQGYFLNYPDPVQGEPLSENKALLLKIFSELYDPDISIQRIEEMVLQIPKLSYRILRLSNSAAMYTGRKIDSIMDAIRQLGIIQIRNWISVLLISALDDIAVDLIERTLIRAKMCQSLARISGMAKPHQAYTVGMLSTIDAILNEKMSELLSKIQLSEELNQALLNREGPLGSLLNLTEAYERANFEKLDMDQFSSEDYTRSYLEGIQYADEVMITMR